MSYTEKTGYFRSADKVSDIYYRICIPKDMPKGIIQISHGMCEYFDRYEGVIKYFTDKGFIVCGNDHIGHGKSTKDSSGLGYFGRDNYRCLAEDNKQLNEILRKTYRSLPYILLGHSMGSFVVRDYMIRFADTVDGVVICGTSGTNKATGLGILLCRFLGLFGKKRRNKFIRSMAFKGYNSHFKDENEKNSWLTRDPAVRSVYDRDPYCNYCFTVDGYMNLLTLLKSVNADDWEEKVPKSLPILIISGEDDPVGNYGCGPAEIHEKLLQQEVNFIELILYSEARHELFNETNRVEVMEDVEKFADRVIEGVLEARGYVR